MPWTWQRAAPRYLALLVASVFAFHTGFGLGWVGTAVAIVVAFGSAFALWFAAWRLSRNGPAEQERPAGGLRTEPSRPAPAVGGQARRPAEPLVPTSQGSQPGPRPWPAEPGLATRSRAVAG